VRTDHFSFLCLRWCRVLAIISRHTKGPDTVLVLAITCMRVFPQDTPLVSSAAGTEEVQQCGILPARGIISGRRAVEKEPTREVDIESQLRRCRYCICSTYNGRAVGLFHILFVAGTTVSYYFKDGQHCSKLGLS